MLCQQLNALLIKLNKGPNDFHDVVDTEVMHCASMMSLINSRPLITLKYLLLRQVISQAFNCWIQVIIRREKCRALTECVGGGYWNGAHTTGDYSSSRLSHESGDGL